MSAAALPSLPAPLPELKTEPVFLGHGKKADLFWTNEDFPNLCTYMLNDNPDNFFLMPFVDKKTGRAKYVKAFEASAVKRIRWAWDTINGTAKSPASVGFYATNANGKSRWGAIDFDAHDGDKLRARDLAFKAFAALFHYPELFLVLGTSGSDGWHLFVFTADYHPVSKWSLLLRNVAAVVGAPVQQGLLEIFPDDNVRGIGYGIRAPGTWNPKSDSFDLIVYERFSKLREHPCFMLGSAKESNASLSALGEPPSKKQAGSPSSKKNTYYRNWLRDFAITAPRSRRDQLCKLIGTTFYQASRNEVLEVAKLQYANASPAPTTPLDGHLADFEELWAGMERNWLAELSAQERKHFDLLTTGAEGDAFRIIRNWSCKDTTKSDFKIVAEELAWRILLSIRGAGKLRRRFCSLGILRKTAEYVPHKMACRYQWIANNEPKRKQAALVSPQWNGDPGDVRQSRKRAA